MDKLPLSIASYHGLIAYKYLEGSVKRSLERELNVPERSDCEFNGWRILLMETCEYAQTFWEVWKCADCSKYCVGSCVVCGLRLLGHRLCILGLGLCHKAAPHHLEPYKYPFNPS